MTLVETFTHTYTEIQIVANRITKDISLSPNLINSTFLDVHACKLFPPVPEDFVKWFSKCMKNRYKWYNSNYNSENRTKEILKEIEVVDNEGLNIDLYLEETNEATKEFIEVSSTMPKERVSKYLQVLDFKKSLPVHERLLFELYFEKELSTRKIAEYLNKEPGYDMSKNRINDMVNGIKNKIKKTQWK